MTTITAKLSTLREKKKRHSELKTTTPFVLLNLQPSERFKDTRYTTENRETKFVSNFNHSFTPHNNRHSRDMSSKSRTILY